MRVRHDLLAADIRRVHSHRFMRVYGYRKMFAQLLRQGWRRLGSNQVRALMRTLGIAGARRGRIPVTTRAVRGRGDRRDLVNRRFQRMRSE